MLLQMVKKKQTMYVRPSESKFQGNSSVLFTPLHSLNDRMSLLLCELPKPQIDAGAGVFEEWKVSGDSGEVLRRKQRV